MVIEPIGRLQRFFLQLLLGLHLSGRVTAVQGLCVWF